MTVLLLPLCDQAKGRNPRGCCSVAKPSILIWRIGSVHHRMNTSWIIEYISWIIEWILLESSNKFCLNHRMNFVRIIEWIMYFFNYRTICSNHHMNFDSELSHKYRRKSNAYQGEFIKYCYKFIAYIEQNQICLRFIINMWELSNAYMHITEYWHISATIYIML